MTQLEKTKKNLLVDQEDVWRLKSQEIQLSSGDDNITFFHVPAKGHMIINKIWGIRGENGHEIKTFEGPTNLEKDHLSNLFIA